MTQSYEVHYTPELVKYAVLKYWAFLVGKAGFFSYGLVLASWLYFIIAGDDIRWVIGLGVAAGAFALFGAFAYQLLSKRAMARFDKLDQGNATLTLDDECLEIESAAGLIELEWSLIKKILKYDRAWLVILPHTYFTVPVTDANDELRQQLESHLPKKKRG